MRSLGSIVLFHPTAWWTSAYSTWKLRAAPFTQLLFIQHLSSLVADTRFRPLIFAPLIDTSDLSENAPSMFSSFIRDLGSFHRDHSCAWMWSEGPKREGNSPRHEVGCVDRRRRVSTMARTWSMWTAAVAFSTMWMCVWTYTHPTDQEALEVFLDGIEEDPRGYLSSWRESNDACGDKWMGIECNEDGRVTVLNLHYRCDQWRCDRPVSEGGGPNELVGTISPWVGNLTELRRFHASHNRLYGPLPSTIGRLRHVFGT